MESWMRYPVQQITDETVGPALETYIRFTCSTEWTSPASVSTTLFAPSELNTQCPRTTPSARGIRRAGSADRV